MGDHGEVQLEGKGEGENDKVREEMSGGLVDSETFDIGIEHEGGKKGGGEEFDDVCFSQGDGERRERLNL